MVHGHGLKHTWHMIMVTSPQNQQTEELIGNFSYFGQMNVIITKNFVIKRM